MADNNDNKLFFGGKAADDFVECHEHISPVSMYLKVLAALFVLTGLTYAVSYANLGPASLPVAMVVAAMKATLVSAFFMHLIYDDKFHVFIFGASLLFVGIFFTFTIFDLESRDRLSEAQATDFRRADGGWDDMGRMGAATNTEASRPACSDGTVPMCDQTFAVCNGEDAHGGEDFLVRRIENECFVSEMVPSVGADGKPVLQDGVAVMVDAGCVLPKLGCVNPHTAEGHKASAAKAAAPAEGEAAAEAPKPAH
ncbi:MAG: cytochrome C oxidase subunit IV family protein [Nannocystales bacterium]